MKRKGILFMLIIVITLLVPQIVSADATVDVIPIKPKAEGTVEITTKLTDENVIAVYATIQECNENTGICYAKVNQSMMAGVDNQYTTSFTLDKSDATYLQYTIHVQTENGWVEYNKDTKVNYDTSSSNGGSNDDNDTPGFEFVFFALSIMFISLLVYRRKR